MFKYKVVVENGFTRTKCYHDMDNMIERMVAEILHSKIGGNVQSPNYRGYDLLYWYNAESVEFFSTLCAVLLKRI